MDIFPYIKLQRLFGSREAFACVYLIAIAVEVLEPAFRGDLLRVLPHGIQFISSLGPCLFFPRQPDIIVVPLPPREAFKAIGLYHCILAGEVRARVPFYNLYAM